MGESDVNQQYEWFGGFLKWGVPQLSSILDWDLSMETNAPLLGTLIFSGTPKTVGVCDGQKSQSRMDDDGG